jgi:hypothetical protein
VAIPEQAALWHWVNEKIVAVVGSKSVYHIDITTTPVKAPATVMFEK